MDCCIVCLQSNCHPFSRITVHSSEWNKEQIQRVVEKHLWWWYLKPQAEGHNRRWICKHCWQEISSFHNFYLKVEMVHKQYGTFLITNMSKAKSKEFISEDIERTFFEKNSTVKDKPCTSSDLVFNKKVYESDSCDQDEKNNIKLLNACIKNEPIIDEFQIYKNHLNVFQAKKQTHDDSLDDDNINNASGSIERNYNGNQDTDYGGNKLTEEREFTDSPEPRTIFGRLKKNDIIDFYDEFQFKLECIICNSTESTFANLCLHYKDHHNMRGFAMCCGVKFSRRHLLIDHLCVHRDPNFFKCNKCHRVYRARDNLNFHLRKNKCTPKFECNQCGKQFLILKNLMRHKLTHYRPKDDKYICKICNKNFDSKALLKKHIHTRNCKLVCNDCGQIFFQNRFLVRHIQNICPGKISKNSNTFSCMEPNDKTIVTSEIVLGGNEDITPIIKNEPSDVAEIYQGGHIASNESNMVQNQEYDNNEYEGNSEDDSFNNDGENNTFRIKAFKNMYTPSVSDDFFREMQYKMECRVCNMILPDFQSLISHYRIVHNKVGYGMCCGKKYYRRGILADHLKLHKDPNLFKCHLCNRKLGTRRGLEKHIEVCAKKFEED